MPRLFVALRPPSELRDLLIDTMEGVEGARWQREEQLHLTLRFVGEVDAPQAEDLADALASVRAEPFALQVRGVGHFATKGRAKALWAAFEPCEALAILQRRVGRACRAAGLVPETRRFVPHITIARLNSSTGAIDHWLAQQGRLTAPAWPVERFVLYESQLAESGASYTPVVQYLLVKP